MSPKFWRFKDLKLIFANRNTIKKFSRFFWLSRYFRFKGLWWRNKDRLERAVCDLLDRRKDVWLDIGIFLFILASLIGIVVWIFVGHATQYRTRSLFRFAPFDNSWNWLDKTAFSTLCTLVTSTCCMNVCIYIEIFKNWKDRKSRLVAYSSIIHCLFVFIYICCSARVSYIEESTSFSRWFDNFSCFVVLVWLCMLVANMCAVIKLKPSKFRSVYSSKGSNSLDQN